MRARYLLGSALVPPEGLRHAPASALRGGCGRNGPRKAARARVWLGTFATAKTPQPGLRLSGNGKPRQAQLSARSRRPTSSACDRVLSRRLACPEIVRDGWVRTLPWFLEHRRTSFAVAGAFDCSWCSSICSLGGREWGAVEQMKWRMFQRKSWTQTYL
jgi:hypothetical protein